MEEIGERIVKGGYWKSPMGINHGLNSQPGDIWVEEVLMDEKVKEIGGKYRLPMTGIYDSKIVADVKYLLSLLSEKDTTIEVDKHELRKMDFMRELLSENDKEIEGLKEEIKGYKTSLSAELLSLEQRDRIKAEARIKELDDINTKLSEALGNAIDDYHKIILRAEQAEIKIKSLEEGVAEIAEGKGRYDLDNHQHAINTIEDMKAIANKLLDKKVERI